MLTDMNIALIQGSCSQNIITFFCHQNAILYVYLRVQRCVCVVGGGLFMSFEHEMNYAVVELTSNTRTTWQHVTKEFVSR